jgi:hypothetical protein
MSWECVSYWIEHHPGLASWVQAVGSIAAILAAVWIASSDSRLRRKAETAAKREAAVRAIAVVGEAGLRVNAAIESMKNLNVHREMMNTIAASLSQSQQHLKEVILSQGVDSMIYTQLFLTRIAVEDAAHLLHAIAREVDYEEEALHPVEDRLNQINAAHTALISLQ